MLLLHLLFTSTTLILHYTSATLIFHYTSSSTILLLHVLFTTLTVLFTIPLLHLLFTELIFTILLLNLLFAILLLHFLFTTLPLHYTSATLPLHYAYSSLHLVTLPHHPQPGVSLRNFLWQWSCQEKLFDKDLVKSSSYGDPLQRTCTKSSSRSLAKRPPAEIFYRDLVKSSPTMILPGDLQRSFAGIKSSPAILSKGLLCDLERPP